jgi:hypothetical protein
MERMGTIIQVVDDYVYPLWRGKGDKRNKLIGVPGGAREASERGFLWGPSGSVYEAFGVVGKAGEFEGFGVDDYGLGGCCGDRG